jgi:predicted dehydrogenase
MVETVRWGVIGTGWIADKFASGLALLPDAELAAVGSRTRSTAEQFAEKYGVPCCHASYDALASDPAVDVVYVATPNPMHRQHCMLCLESGKPVLCEKPFALNAAEAEDVVRMARDKRLFLMEAMWTRFFPIMDRVRELAAEGAIGDIQMLSADLCIGFAFDPMDRRYALDLGGGTLLDLGVYAVSFASMLMGPPSKVATMGHIGRTGVDEQAGMILGYDQGQMSTLYSSIRVDSPVDAVVMGTRGQIRIHPWWISPSRLTLSRQGENDITIEMPYEGSGYQFEASEVMQCLRAGKLESDLMPLAETVSIMQTMDTIRGQWGLRYPTE